MNRIDEFGLNGRQRAWLRMNRYRNDCAAQFWKGVCLAVLSLILLNAVVSAADAPADAYTKAYDRAVKERKNLAVYVACEPSKADDPDWIHARVNSLEGFPKRCVVTSVPNGSDGLWWRSTHDLDTQKTDTAPWAAQGATSPSGSAASGGSCASGSCGQPATVRRFGLFR